MVLLYIGVNDITSGEVPGTFDDSNGVATGTVARIGQMIDDILSAAPSAHIYISNIAPWLHDDQVNASLDAMRPELAALLQYRAGKGENVTLVDMYSGFETSMLQTDLAHPNASGDAFIAGQWLQALQSDGYFVSPQSTASIRIEPETGILSGNMRTGYDGNDYVATYFTSGYQTDYVTVDFTVENAGLYRILGYIKTTEKEQNSLFVRVNEGELVPWFVPVTGTYTGTYASDRNPYYVYLTTGTHSVRLYSRRNHLRIDWIEFQYLGVDATGDADGDGVANPEDTKPNEASQQ